MSGGGKGGSSTSANSVPAWVEEPAKRNLARAEEISQIGYTPYYGPDVAAFTPQQIAGFNNANNMAGAYGMAGGGVSVPTPQTYAGGVQGYSSAPIYQQALDEFAQQRPGQYDAIMAQFIDPYTGTSPTAATAQTTAANDGRNEWMMQQMGDPEHGLGNPTGSIGGFGNLGATLGQAADIAGLNGNFGNAFSGGGLGGISPEGGQGGGFGGNK